MSILRSLSARRRLIGCIVVVAALFALSYIDHNRGLVAQVNNATAVVGVAKTPSTNPTDAQVEAAVQEAIALAGGLPSNVGPGKKIVIQPNLVEAGWPSSDLDPGVPYFRGVVTDVRVVRAIVNMCIDAGASVNDIIICEGSAGFRQGTSRGFFTCRQATRKAFYDAGFDRNKDMIDDVTGVQLVDANFVREDVDDVYPRYPQQQDDGYNPGRVTKAQFDGSSLVVRNYFIPNCVAECDVLIRVPVLKTHDLAGYTGGLKLAFGIAPSDIYHATFGYDPCLDKMMKWNLLHQQAWGIDELQTNAKGMVDMTLARPPDMVVIDGLVGVTTGPTRVISPATVPGTASPYMSCIIASHDVVAADTVGTLAIGYKVSSVPGIGYAADHGLGQDHPALIDIRGVPLDDFRQWWPKHPLNNDWPTGTPGSPDPPVFYSGLTCPDGAHAGGTISVKPKVVYMPNGVCKSELYVDGELVALSLDSTVVTWNVGDDIAEGVHDLTYVVYDMMLNKASLDQTINIHSGNTVTSVLSQPDGTMVYVSPVYVTGRATTIDNYTFFVSTENGISGLRVVRPAGASNWQVGTQMSITGTLSTVNGERVLTLSDYVGLPGIPIAEARVFRNSDLGGSAVNGVGIDEGVGPYNVGCLVKTVGKVTTGGSDYFYVDDGSLANDAVGKLKVYCGSIAQPTPGSYVRLTGWSCTENDAGVIRRVLVLRSSGDIVTY